MYQILQDVADDFVENVAAFACELAKHRESPTLEAKDLQLALGVLSWALEGVCEDHGTALRSCPPPQVPHAPDCVGSLTRQRRTGI